MLLAAIADTVTVFDNFAPDMGAVSVTVGAVLLSFETVTVITFEVACAPEVSNAVAVKVCGPLLTFVVFQVKTYGEAGISGLKLTPSIKN